MNAQGTTSPFIFLRPSLLLGPLDIRVTKLIQLIFHPAPARTPHNSTAYAIEAGRQRNKTWEWYTQNQRQITRQGPPLPPLTLHFLMEQLVPTFERAAFHNLSNRLGSVARGSASGYVSPGFLDINDNRLDLRLIMIPVLRILGRLLRL